MCKLRSLFDKSLNFKYYRAGQLIYCGTEAGLLRQGVIAVSHVVEEGDSQIIQILGVDSVINVFDSACAYYQSVTDCVVQFVPQERIRRDDLEISQALLWELQEANRALINHITGLSGRTVKVRLQWALNELEAKGCTIPLGSHKGRGKLPLLSAITGCDPCTISRALKGFVSYDTQTGSRRHD